jgi:hypothetical protein
MKKEMTIAQALNELKLLDKKISKKTESDFIGVKSAGKILNGFNPEDAKADLQSLNDMIDRRAVIRNKINTSNSIAEVTIDGNRMTVSEAINMKDTIEYKARLLRRMSSKFSNATQTVDYQNEEVKERLDVQLQKIDDIELKNNFTKSYTKSQGAELVDPIGLGDYTKALDDSVMNFQNEVDYILSTSNATTVIEA